MKKYLFGGILLALALAAAVMSILGWYSDRISEAKQAGYDLAELDYIVKINEANAKVEETEANLKKRSDELLKLQVSHEHKQRKQALETEKWRDLFNNNKTTPVSCNTTVGSLWLINQALGYDFENQGAPADKRLFVDQGRALSSTSSRTLERYTTDLAREYERLRVKLNTLIDQIAVD